MKGAKWAIDEMRLAAELRESETPEAVREVQMLAETRLNKCGEQDCIRIFVKVSLLLSHLKSTHTGESNSVPNVSSTHKDTTIDFINFIEPVSTIAKKNIFWKENDPKFDPDEQVTKFLLDLHGKDNISRSQISSVTKFVLEHLLQQLSNSISHVEEIDTKDNVKKL